MNRYDIGRRIEAYRDKLHMSTQELAERIQRSQATISRIENGKQGLTFELLSRIASELRTHPFSLLSDEPLRGAMLLPPAREVGGGGECAPGLLANALHGGRVARDLRIDAAAGILAVTASEVESIELGIASPPDALLEKMCELYGLDAGEMRALRRFGEDAPKTARGLAYLQQLFSHVHRMIRETALGNEKSTLESIGELLLSADTDSPLPPHVSSDDIGLFLHRLSLHLVNALRDSEFRGKMLELADREAQAGS